MTFKEQALTCIYDQPAFCTDACPFALDVRDLIGKIRRGSFDAAFRGYRTAVLFPGIVSGCCDAGCSVACLRNKTDDAVDLRSLEEALVRYARRTDPVQYNVPKKSERVAVIGAGIGGLACALRLCNKKYDVTVFEKDGRIGGYFPEPALFEPFMADIEKQFKYESYHLECNREIHSLDALDFDAVYVATGKDGCRFGLKENENGVFLGGALVGSDMMQAIADGIEAANLIENYLKTKMTGQPKARAKTKLTVDESLLILTPRIPADPFYSREEAMAEAERCFLCNCTACRRHSDIMRFHKKLPKQLGDEVAGTVYAASTFSTRMATRLLGCENVYALGREICPLDIDFETFLLESHRIMVRQQAMPKVFSAFFLDDMRFSNGEDAAVVEAPPGCGAVRYAFFPGCQMGASDPSYVRKTYEKLLELQPDTALMMKCCGAPALWGGEEALLTEESEHIREEWAALGKPTVIFACPTCERTFERCNPEIPRVNLYEFLLQQGFQVKKSAANQTVSVFDPCSSRTLPGVQAAVRALTREAGYTLSPLPYEGGLAACCGFGGQAQIANPLYTDDMTAERIGLSDRPYLTYCTNCRDAFLSKGKETLHILDLLLDTDAPETARRPPDLTKRRENRTALKKELLQTYWSQQSMKEKQPAVNLLISDRLRQKLNDEWTLIEHVEQTVAYCEKTGNRLADPETGNFFGHLLIGFVTYWVEYRPSEDGFRLINAYHHRMQIKEAGR